MKNWKKFNQSSVLNMPIPTNINLFWTFGSMMGMTLMIQIISGVFLSFHYCPNIMNAFKSVMYIDTNMNNGWFIHSMHCNGASLFFLLMYVHVARGLYYNSYHLSKVWNSGMMIMLILMLTAFLGYILPWGQMSFWGATVITNLLSTIPYLGICLTNWLWGGFSINNATLNRFYSLHFLTPFLMLLLMMLHLMFLHESLSSNPLGTKSVNSMMTFNNYATTKDTLSMMMMIFVYLSLINVNPMMLNDPENFIPANPLNTPTHIQPEWYFLFAYSILRSIPNKLGGVVAMAMSIMITLMLPMYKQKTYSLKFNQTSSMMFWLFTSTFMMLTWIGMNPVQSPFTYIGQFTTMIYFMYFSVSPMILMKWWMLLNKNN